MSVDKAMVSRMLQKLEAKGYLVRKEDEKDARSKKVLALPPAVEIHKQGRGLSEQFFDILTEDFTDEEADRLNELLAIMAKKAAALNQPPSSTSDSREESNP